MTVSAAPGWYGKLPVLGDFASRRLPPGFVTAWDRWLQQGMTQLRQQLGTSWLDAYMTAPVWRFVLGAQTLDEHPWAGVMLPSVDRVGRYFPLTVCASIPGIAAADDVATVEQWLGDIETAARTGLNADISLDAFDTALAACIVPAARSVPEASSSALASVLMGRSPIEHFHCGPDSGLPSLFSQTGAVLAAQLMSGHSLWWCHNEAGYLGGFLGTGMPDAHSFAEMIQYTPEWL